MNDLLNKIYIQISGFKFFCSHFCYRPGVAVDKQSPAVPMTGAVNAIGATPRVVPAASPAPP